MDYKVLDIDSVCDYLLDIDEINDFFDGDDITASEIGDGNLNYVYIVSSVNDEEKSLIVKQAVPYLRCVGEEFPLSRERMNYEIRALENFYKQSQEFVPEIFHANEDMSLVVMQYLDEHIIMRKGLMEKVRYPNFSDHISSYLANTLFFTSSLALQSDEKRALIDRFNSNTQLCKLTEDFVFTFAFMENETNDNGNVQNNPLAQRIFNDDKFKLRVLDLKYKFMNQTDALIHGDLHTGSIMLNENETYVIDPEFAFVGPFGFDIGALLANLVNSYIHHEVVTKDKEYQEYILTIIQDTLYKFEKKFFDLWNEQKSSALIEEGFLNEDNLESYKIHFIKNILRDTVGFAGCKMARRIFGVAGVEEIRGIEDKSLRAQAEEITFNIAREFVMKYDHISFTDEIVTIIKEKCAR